MSTDSNTSWEKLKMDREGVGGLEPEEQVVTATMETDSAKRWRVSKLRERKGEGGIKLESRKAGQKEDKD